MIGTPDDIFRDSVNDVCIVVDYKFSTLCDSGVSLDYAAQTVQYAAMVHRLCDVPNDRIVCLVAAFNPDDCELRIVHVNDDERIRQGIEERVFAAGDHFWNGYVMQGKIPVLKRGETAAQERDTDPEIEKKVAALVDEILALKEEIRPRETLLKAKEAELNRLAGQDAGVADLVRNAVGDAGGKVTVRRQVSFSRLEEMAERAGVDLDQVTKASDTIDPKRLTESLKALGVPAERIEAALADARKRRPDIDAIEKLLNVPGLIERKVSISLPKTPQNREEAAQSPR